MTFPTPGGVPSYASLLTGTKSGLPANWQNLPTTAASEAETVSVVSMYYGSSTSEAFKAWYDAARRQDPSLTPNQAAGTYLTGTTIATGLGETTSLLSNVPGAATSAAAKAASSFSNPLTGWTHNIEQWVIRGFEMLLGIGLIIVALAKLASDTPAGKAAIKAGKAAAIL